MNRGLITNPVDPEEDTGLAIVLREPIDIFEPIFDFGDIPEENLPPRTAPDDREGGKFFPVIPSILNPDQDLPPSGLEAATGQFQG